MNSTLLPRALALVCCLIVSSLCFSNSNPLKFENSNLLEDCNNPPTILCPPFVWLKPTESDHPDRTGYPVVESGSGCDEPIITYYDEKEIINICHIVITRIWIAQDPNNMSLVDTCHQTIKRVDEEAPVFMNPPQDIDVYATTANCRSQVFWAMPEIYDNVLIDEISITGKWNGIVSTVENGGFYNEGLTEVTYFITDKCGNFTKYTFNINVRCADCHIQCPDDITLAVGSDVSPQFLGEAQSYSGNMDCGEASISFNDIMVETGCNGAMTFCRIWSATFEKNSGIFTCKQNIELTNNAPINLSACPPDVVVANNFTVVNWEEPVASNGLNSVTLSSNFMPGQFFPQGITTIIYTATDDCGNEEECSFKVSVLEDISHLDCPDDISILCDGNGGALVDWSPPTYDGSCSSCVKGRNIPGFIYIGSFNGSQYYCSQKNYTYAQAKLKAERLGGYIVSINSQEENDFVASYIGSSSALIGLSDFDNEGHFKWHSGESVSFTNWYYNQPNDKDNYQDAVEIMRSGEWNDVDNDSSLEFVLEIPCEFVTQLEGPGPGTYLEIGVYNVLYQIADGCGLEQYCQFTISVEEGISIECVDDIYVEIPSNDNDVEIEFETPKSNSCCDACPESNACGEVIQISGPSSGSRFEVGVTEIVFQASDPCGHVIECRFNVYVDRRPGSRLIEEDFQSSLINQIDRGEKEVLEIEVPEVFKVYPNPVSNLMTLEIPNVTNLKTASIIDQRGKLVRSLDINQMVTQIDIRYLDKGLYFLRIDFNSERTQILKIVKL